MRNKILKKCENPHCNEEFKVSNTISGRKRKYCKRKCQIPWIKGKKQSEETKRKRSNSIKQWYKTDAGKDNAKKTLERNLSDSNPWRNKNRKPEWREKSINSRLKTLKSHPEIKRKYASMIGKKHSVESIKKMSEIKKRQWMDKNSSYNTKECHKRMSSCKSGKNNPNYGKHPSEKTLEKMRKSALDKFCPRYNPIACKIIEEYGKNNGYNFQHAMNGGEVRIAGYSLDGYDKEKNVAIEYLEKLHETKIKPDLLRKKTIISELDCKFIEIWYDGRIIIT